MNIKENDKVYYTLFLINKMLESNYTDEHKIKVISMFSEYSNDEVNNFINTCLDNNDVIETLANDLDIFLNRVRKQKEQNSN